MQDNVIRILQRRQGIVDYNNYQILRTAIFYENFLLHAILEPNYFQKGFATKDEANRFAKKRLRTKCRYLILKKICINHDVNVTITEQDFLDFVQFRNDIVHNLSFPISHSDVDGTQICVGGKFMTWKSIC